MTWEPPCERLPWLVLRRCFRLESRQDIAEAMRRLQTNLSLCPGVQQSLQLFHALRVFALGCNLWPAMLAPELGPLGRGDGTLPVDLCLKIDIVTNPCGKRLGGLNPGNSLPDEARRIRQNPRTPPAVVIVDDAQHRGMDVEREIDQRIVQAEKLEANAGQVILAAREEEPAGPGAVAFGIGGQLLRRIFVGLQSKGVHEHVAAQVIPEQILKFGQAGDGPGAILVTT